MDFSRFRPEVDPQEILRMITWMTAGYLDEKRRTGTPVEPVRVMEEFSRWLEHFRKISYKEEFFMSDLIQVEHLTKDYGKGRGVFDVSFGVSAGEAFGFLGPNGAGKPPPCAI